MHTMNSIVLLLYLSQYILNLLLKDKSKTLTPNIIVNKGKFRLHLSDQEQNKGHISCLQSIGGHSHSNQKRERTESIELTED